LTRYLVPPTPQMGSPDTSATQIASATGPQMLCENLVLNDPIVLQLLDMSFTAANHPELPHLCDVQVPHFDEPTLPLQLLNFPSMANLHSGVDLDTSLDAASHAPIMALDNFNIEFLPQLPGHVQPANSSSPTQANFPIPTSNSNSKLSLRNRWNKSALTRRAILFSRHVKGRIAISMRYSMC
jgi:hypothetical protein